MFRQTVSAEYRAIVRETIKQSKDNFGRQRHEQRIDKRTIERFTVALSYEKKIKSEVL